MKLKFYLVLLFVCILACNNGVENYKDNMKIKPESEMVFDKVKWNTKNGKNYPFRDKMLNDVVYNDTIRLLNKSEILVLLGEPSYYRENKNFLYYTINQKRLGSWPLHTKSMVIKFANENKIEWIKIYK